MMGRLSDLARMTFGLPRFELSRIQRDFLPRLRDDCDDVEALLLLMNAARTIRHLAEAADIGKVVQDGAEVLGASIIDAARRVEDGAADSAWLQARMPSLLDDVNDLAQCPVRFT